MNIFSSWFNNKCQNVCRSCKAHTTRLTYSKTFSFIKNDQLSIEQAPRSYHLHIINNLSWVFHPLFALTHQTYTATGTNLHTWISGNQSQIQNKNKSLVRVTCKIHLDCIFSISAAIHIQDYWSGRPFWYINDKNELLRPKQFNMSFFFYVIQIELN